MENNKLLEIYLRKVIEFCQAYDAFSIPAAMMAGGATIKLQDVYTYLSPIKREEYEKIKSPDVFSKNGNNSIEDIIARIDAKIAELEALEAEEREQKSNSNIDTKKTTRDEKKIETENFEFEKDKLNWIWFLSAPGGGKTTFLKMYSLANAYKLYIKLFGRREDLFEDWESIEAICDQLDVPDGGACPFFISVRELKEEDYPRVEKHNGFRKIIIDTISSLVDGELSVCEIETLLKNIKEIVYIIDSVEEFSSDSFRNNFLKGLEAYSAGSLCYLSSRYREYMENVKDAKLKIDGVERSPKEEYVIEGLQKDIVRKFAEKWYYALNKLSGRKKLDVDKDFLIPLYKNANVKNLISNPLELTSLLMISSYDSYLPSDYAKIYGRSIELWLSWNNHARYNYEDIMRQLSQVAYKMAISEHEKIIVRPDTLIQYILQARKDLKRYYQQVWPEDETSIDEFIQFLCRSHLISKSTEGFDFIHRQYQAYLVAYCITTNNFSRETRKQSKFDYIKEHIREKDDFWNQIYKIIAMIDIELRDDIIATLFELSENENESSSDNYYVSRLIELAIIPGVNFDEYERERLIGLIIHNENRWRLFGSKRVDLHELLNLNDEYGNELFIRAAIKKHAELSENGKDDFREIIATTLFYCIWHCAVSDQLIKDALIVFFDNFINTNIVEMIFDSKELTEQQIRVKEIVCSVGREAIETGGFSDCYMIIAAILGYEDNPYRCVDNLIKQNDFESAVIAANILVIATWLIRCNKAARYGYGFEVGRLDVYANFVLEGILDNKHSKIRRDYLAAFADIFAIGATKGNESTWFRKDVFDLILRTALADYAEDGLLFVESSTGFNRCFEHISLYPCTFKDGCQSVFSALNIDKISLVKQLNAIYDKTDDIMIKVRATKLLILMSDMKHECIINKIIEIEKQGNDYRIKQKLRSRDQLMDYEQSLTQIKQYASKR